MPTKYLLIGTLIMTQLFFNSIETYEIFAHSNRGHMEYIVLKFRSIFLNVHETR